MKIVFFGDALKYLDDTIHDMRRRQYIIAAIIILVIVAACILFATRSNPANPLYRECDDAIGNAASMCAY